MNKTNIKLIPIFAILSLTFGLFFTTPVYAERFTVGTGVVFTPYNYPIAEYSPTPANTKPVVIPGCGNRTTGYSIDTGDSCINNYVTAPAKITKNTNTSNTVSTTETTNTVTTNDTSNTNESFGSLTANALVGSNSFMPSGLLQWIFFIALIVAIIYLWRYVHRSEEVYMSEPLKHA
ncbi:MAG: hypothetical protein WCS86_03300 [Candidatus Paceibacterota bacterium]